MTKSLRMASVFAVAAMTSIAYGQYTGTSHPDPVPVTTSPEPAQPVTYVAPAPVAAAPAPIVYKPYNPQPPAGSALPASSATAGSPQTRMGDGMVVGDEGPGSAAVPAPGLARRTSAERDYGSAAYDGETELPGSPRDVDAGIVVAVEGPPNQLPVGTLLKVRIREQISTTSTAAGQIFHGELTDAVKRDGRVLLPAGAEMEGRVTEVHGGKRISGGAVIHLQPLAVTLPDGTRYKVVGQVVDTDLYDANRVDGEGTIVSKNHTGKTLAVLGLATGSGAAAGGVLAGAPGALVGAGIGAGVGTVVWLKQDRQNELPAGTQVVFALNEPLAVGVQ